MTRLAVLLLVGALAATVGALAGAAGASPVRSAANTATFPDSTGEDPAAPDITSITVSNDDAGLIRFRVEIPNRPTLTPDMLLQFFLDTDANEATGEPNVGTDYAIQLAPGSVRLFRWDGSTYSSAGVSQTSLVYSYANGASLTISANELNATKRFRFAVIAISGIVIDANGNPDDTNAKSDVAPDPGHGLFTYDVKTAPLALVVKSFGQTPKSPKAGGSFSVFLTAARSDNGATIKAGTVTCRATVAFKPIVARVHRVSGNRATCSFSIPKTAKGKTVRGTIVLQFEGLTVRRTFSAKIG
jgi:hypothetical protein